MTPVNVIYALAIIWALALIIFTIVFVVFLLNMRKESKRMDERMKRRRKAFDNHLDEIRKKGSD
jgi:uncharacterized membrane protein YciS (DUF1049 family)